MSLSMLGNSGKLQDNVLSKDEARIRLKREQNAKRAERQQNGKSRSIGLELDALDAQVVEARFNRQQAKDADKMDRFRLQEMDRIIETQNEWERNTKAIQIEEVKSSWDNAVSSKKTIADIREPAFNPEKTGISASQIFTGEDPSKSERVRAQKDQMKRWVQEQIAEKANAKKQLFDEDMGHSYAIKNIDGVREALEQEDYNLRHSRQLEITRQNKENGKLKQDTFAQTQEEFAKLSAEEKGKLTSLDLFDEDTHIAMNEYGRVIRKDKFKGYTPEQSRTFLQENGVALQQKRDIQEQERLVEHQWAVQKSMLTRAMDVASAEDKALVDAEKEKHFAVLARQRVEEKSRRDASAKDRFGKIEPGFFSNFGTSAR